MRRFALLVCIPALAAALLAATARTQPIAPVAAAPALAASPVDEAPLIVHEWGTFTSFSGSDGVQLEFRPLVENDLPGFVMNPWRQLQKFNLGKSRLWAFQRMETPVTYFYTPVERDVQVRVLFPEGLLTEFYPPVRSMTPADLGRYSDQPQMSDAEILSLSGILGLEEEAAVPEVAPLENSSLDWGTVHLIPIESLSTRVQDETLARSMGRYLADKIVPEADEPHYAHAREVDAALVNVQFDQEHPYVSTGDYFERFLFYRGVGNFQMPLTLQGHGAGAYELTNAGPDEVRSLFLVTSHDGAVRFNTYSAIEANGTLTLAESSTPSDVDTLAEAMVTALSAEGLYEKEARAMVNSWRSSWFQEEGTRLLYMVPQQLTDELLPLEVSPQPDEVVRVLVGRIEIMSPEDEARAIDVVQRSAAGREQDGGNDLASAGPQRQQAFEELVALGRLAEPALVRVRNITDDPVLKHEARRLIHELRTHYEQQVAAQ